MFEKRLLQKSEKQTNHGLYFEKHAILKEMWLNLLPYASVLE